MSLPGSPKHLVRRLLGLLRGGAGGDGVQQAAAEADGGSSAGWPPPHGSISCMGQAMGEHALGEHALERGKEMNDK